MNLKQRTKSVMSRALARMAMSGVLDRFEKPILSMTPYLLDPDVLPPLARPRPLRGLDVEAPCNPYNPFHRSLYWFGRLHERGVEDFLRAVLTPGDTFVDVGANFGHMSFLAAALVGGQGRVHAFEPHPQLVALLRELVESRRRRNIAVHDVGLAEADGVLSLLVNPEHLGASTFRVIGDDQRHEFRTSYPVKVARGDDVLLRGATPGRSILKVDVEGCEPSVIQGMMHFIRRFVDAAVIEVTPVWQGGPEGVRRMFESMRDLGLSPYVFSGPDATLPLRPLPTTHEIAAQENLVFLRDDRRSSLLRRAGEPARPRKRPPGTSGASD